MQRPKGTRWGTEPDASPWRRRLTRNGAPLAVFDSQGHRQMWYQLWCNRKLLAYRLKSKDVFV